MILHLFPLIFWAILITIITTPIFIWIAKRLKLLDQPYSSPHKIHALPIPKASGLAVGYGILVLYLAYGILHTGEIQAILVASAIIFIFGLWDDIRPLSPGWKFLGQFLGTLVLVFQGVYIQMLDSMWIFNILLTFIWMIGMTNAFNLVDSMDGLAVGLSAIAAAFFMLVTIDAAQPHLSSLSAIILGCCIGMLYFNALPAQTFLGDSGSQSLGFMLAAMAIAYTPPGLPQPSSWFVPILLLGVPIFDTSLVFISRLRQNKAVYEAGLDHTFHRLVKMGVPPSRAVLSMHLAAIINGCIAFLALPLAPLWANTIFLLTLVTWLFTLLWLEKKGGA